MKPALLLNSTYEPLSIIGWKHAIKLLCKDRAHVVEKYTEMVSSAKDSWNLPSVIRLFNHAEVKRKEVNFSRLNVYRRDGFTCQYCNTEFEYDELTFDHVKPKSQGGQTKWSNIVTCCEDCNLEKDDRTPEEAGMDLKSSPSKPGYIPFSMNHYREDRIDSKWKSYLWM